MEKVKAAMNIGQDHKFGESFDIDLQDRKRTQKLLESEARRKELKREKKRAEKEKERERMMQELEEIKR